MGLFGGWVSWSLDLCSGALCNCTVELRTPHETLNSGCSTLDPRSLKKEVWRIEVGVGRWLTRVSRGMHVISHSALIREQRPKEVADDVAAAILLLPSLPTVSLPPLPFSCTPLRPPRAPSPLAPSSCRLPLFPLPEEPRDEVVHMKLPERLLPPRWFEGKNQQSCAFSKDGPTTSTSRR